MDKYIGRLLDNRYEILEQIGSGGIAVYKARCHRLNRLVAIKILKDDYMMDEEFRRRFHTESQAVAMLSHPNIVSVYDVSTSLMADYIVMELIEGITLKQYMEKKGTLNWKETLHFAVQIGKALEHAHSRGIVHRDIKPHNVMVLKNGSVKVTDFGIARVMSKGNTLTKEALGSVHYISPEQAKGGRVDSRSDIYSLGVVMYEMMAGRPPYDGDSPVAVAIKHINGGAPMPSTLNPNIPGGLEQIIMKAMAHELCDRYVSATRMLADMDEFRKDPAMLFDYNTPPLDVVTRMPKAPQLKPEMHKQPVTPAAAPLPRRKSPEELKAQRADREREARRQRRKEAEEKKSRAATIAIISCAVVALIAIIIFLIILIGNGGVQPNQNLVEVPELVGNMFDQLEEIPDLDIIRENVYDDRVPAGQIISHRPLAGTQVAKGSRVVVTVSLGPVPKVIYMNDLIGMREDRARNFLNSLSLNLDIKTELEYSEDVQEGEVIRTVPDKDTELTSGQTIVLFVSQGIKIETGKMPNLVELTEEFARNALDRQNLNLQVTVEEEFDSLVPAGSVIRTEPEANGELKTGQTVKLYISKGPEKKMLPNLEGMNIESAVNLLTNAGFRMPLIEREYSDKKVDTVIRQSHEKNVEIDITTQITLYISDGPAPTQPTQPPTPPVTKDVVINLQGAAAEGSITVRVLRLDSSGDAAGEAVGQVVYEATLEQNTEQIVLVGETGLGEVTYFVFVDEESAARVTEKVSF